MQPLSFRSDSKLFDGHCVRLDAISGKKVVHCGITLAALKQMNSHLPHEGLLPSELFVEAFDRNAELGSTVAIVGSGPIGLAALLTGEFYSPAEIIMVDLDQNRLDTAKRVSATATVNELGQEAARQVVALTSGRGNDTALAPHHSSLT